MDQAPAVGQRQRAQHRTHHRGGGVRGHGAAFAQELAQRAAVDEFHDEEHVPGRVDALVEHVDQARVGHAGDGAGLAFEADAERLVVVEARVHHLRRHQAAQPHVDGPVNHRHAPARDARSDAVAAVEDVALSQFSHRLIAPSYGST